jgi:hypothetical protein
MLIVDETAAILVTIPSLSVWAGVPVSDLRSWVICASIEKEKAFLSTDVGVETMLVPLDCDREARSAFLWSQSTTAGTWVVVSLYKKDGWGTGNRIPFFPLSSPPSSSLSFQLLFIHPSWFFEIVLPLGLERRTNKFSSLL